ncbi:hypothetical protein HanLR1_Chr09g0307251 [Helianthus annuus]|nr:hypothetical protein HanHA89_Chr09g0327781 [Helianthus annuus]KAJ0706460.1 hypothetical protein HanLR1_Chr09g0307251 [Helianthus annuus]
MSFPAESRWCWFLILLLQIARKHIRTREELKQRKPGVDFNGDNDFQTEIPA